MAVLFFTKIIKFFRCLGVEGYYMSYARIARQETKSFSYPPLPILKIPTPTF